MASDLTDEVKAAISRLISYKVYINRCEGPNPYRRSNALHYEDGALVAEALRNLSDQEARDEK